MEINKYIQMSPTFKLLEISKQIQSSLVRSLTSEGVNYLQSLILVAIYFHQQDYVRPKDLTQALGNTKGNISHSLAKLEDLGWVKRKLVKEDHRGYEIGLTSKAKKSVGGIIKHLNNALVAIEKELEAMGSSAEDFIEQLERIKDIHQT